VELFDTRTRTTAPLRAPRTVRLYVCGITPYDATHLGHAFLYTHMDVLVRWLTARGHRVRHVRNVTDVDDDIIRVARERGVDYRELAATEIARFDEDLAALGCWAPDVAPRATATVPAILTAVRGLVDAGAAYALDDGRVYFDVQRAERFGALSRLDRDAMLPQFAEKGGDPEAPGKRDALDFLLWQPSAPDEPAWDSAWGPGRPGWHIECSTMAMEELGPTIDLHGGGSDLTFPHHEAEIVQAEELTGQRPFARSWLHCAMVCGEDGEKMAKSRGNLAFVADLRTHTESAALRLLILQHHYRQGWCYQATQLPTASEQLKRWRAAAERGDQEAPGAREEVHAALDADLDTPRALAVLDAAADAGAGATVRWGAGLLGVRLEPASA